MTAEIAEAPGCELGETVISKVTIVDGRRIPVPRMGPLQITFLDRARKLETVVLGEERLLGQISLEAMDLIVDSLRERFVSGRAGGPLFRA